MASSRPTAASQLPGAVASLDNQVPWDAAACLPHDPSVFFPEEGKNSPGVELAKAICGGCPVRPACLELALARGEPHGVWGGMSTRERHAARHARERRRPRT